MTRLIDADALINTLNEENIPVDVRVNYEIMNAPTIEPFTDNISRSQAIKGVSEWATDILHPDRLVKEDAIYILESLPSAEQVTGKLKNPDDSLLTADSEACKEQKSKLDLISRQDAKRIVSGDGKYFGRVGRNVLHEMWTDICSLPSADKPTGWIPVSERLPEKGERVLVTVWNDVTIAWRNIYGGWESAEDMYEKGDVTAWMPLPTPYKGGDTE